MSLLVNLLPDLRQAKQREQRRRQMALGLSVLVWVVCAGAILILFLFSAGQGGLILARSNSITSNTQKLQNQSGLLDALTAAQHLKSLPALYSNRVLFTKFLQAYSDSDPSDTTLTSLTVDESNMLTVNGVSKSYASLAKLQRALELSNISVGSGAAAHNTPYFTNVTLQSAVNASGKGIAFTFNATLAPEVLHGK